MVATFRAVRELFDGPLLIVVLSGVVTYATETNAPTKEETKATEAANGTAESGNSTTPHSKHSAAVPAVQQPLTLVVMIVAGFLPLFGVLLLH